MGSILINAEDGVCTGLWPRRDNATLLDPVDVDAVLYAGV